MIPKVSRKFLIYNTFVFALVMCFTFGGIGSVNYAKANDGFDVEFIVGTYGSDELLTVNDISGDFNLPLFSEVNFTPPTGYIQIGWTNDGETFYFENDNVKITENITFTAVFAKLDYLGVSFRKGMYPGVRFGFQFNYVNISRLPEAVLNGIYTTDTTSVANFAVANFSCVNGYYYGAAFNFVIINFQSSYGSIDIAVSLTADICDVSLNINSISVEGGKIKIKNKAKIAYENNWLTEKEANCYGYFPWTGYV